MDRVLTGADDDPATAWALAYPFDPPETSFRIAGGRVEPATGRPDPDALPVLAVGSNRAPRQLMRKFKDLPGHSPIEVTVGMLADHDVVLSAHFARYGSMPARLWPAPGTTVQVAVTWLAPDTLARMHQTEGAANYRFDRMVGVDLRLENGRRPDAVWAYCGLHNAFAPRGQPLAFAGIRAQGRQFPTETQTGGLAQARDCLAPDAPLADFIRGTIGCPVTRSQRIARLRRWTVEAAEPSAPLRSGAGS